MALDATIGSPDANSYVTVTGASSYFADRAHSLAWENEEEQGAALVTASRMLDWYITWKGFKSSAEQSMNWPRMNVVRPDSSLVADNIIPMEVKVAVFELALSSLESDRTSDGDMAGLGQIKAGSLSIKTDGGGTTSTSPDTIPEKIWKILSDLTSKSGIGVVRLVRA